MNTDTAIDYCAPHSVARFIPASEPIQLERVLRLQGYKDFAKVRRAVMRAARSAVDEANAIAEPEVAYRIVPVDELDGGKLQLKEPPVTIRCAAFEQHLATCKQVVVYVLTAGAQFDDRVTDLHDPAEVLNGLLLESAAWMCIENTTRQFLKMLRSNAKRQGLGISRRLGPGYQYRVGHGVCEWPLEQQHELFAVFQNETIPVRLLESAAMLPKMSRSGLVGVRPS